MPIPALAALAPLVMQALPAVLPSVLGALAGPAGQAAQGILGQLTKSLFSQDGEKSGVFSEKVNISVENPLAKLNPLLGEFGRSLLGVGDFLKNIGEQLQGKPRKLENGKEIVKPRLLDPHACTVHRDQARDLCSEIHIHLDASAAAESATGASRSRSTAWSRGGFTVGGVKIDGAAFSSGLSKEQQKILDEVKDPTQKAQMKAQMQMQNLQNLMQFLSNIVRIQGDISKSIVQNIRS